MTFKYIIRHLLKISIYLQIALESEYLYPSPRVIKMIKSRRMRWVGNVARMGGGGMYSIG
jgi:hypothetical protein